MKLLKTLVTSACLVAMIGCNAARQQPRDSGRVNAWLMGAANDTAKENAIIAERTLYPYHFVSDSAKLNGLGQQDLGVLAAHYKENPGKLNVRQANTPDELYEARMKHVVDELAASGVDTDRIAIEDGLPGGDGIASERVVSILSPDAAGQGQGQRSSAPVGAVGSSTRTGLTGITEGVR